MRETEILRGLGKAKLAVSGRNFANGSAIVHGPGTSTSDSIHDVSLSDGEAVLPAKTVQAMGPKNIARLIEQTNGEAPKQGLRSGGNYAYGVVGDADQYIKPTVVPPGVGDAVNTRPTAEAARFQARQNVQANPVAVSAPPNIAVKPAMSANPIDPKGLKISGTAAPAIPLDPPRMTPPSYTPVAEATPAAASRMQGMKNAGGALLSNVKAGAGRTLRVGGGIAGIGLEGASAYNDMEDLHDNTDKVARVAEGAGRVASAGLGAAAGASMGSVVPVVGTAIGGLLGGAAGYFAPDAVNAAVNWATGSDAKLASKTAATNRAERRATEIATATAGPTAAAAPAASGPITSPATIEQQTERARAAKFVSDTAQQDKLASYMPTAANEAGPGSALVNRGNAGLRTLASNPQALEQFNRVQGLRGNGITAAVGANGNMEFSGARAAGAQSASEKQRVADNLAAGNVRDENGNFRSAATQKAMDEMHVNAERNRAWELDPEKGIAKFDTEQVDKDKTAALTAQSLRTDATNRYGHELDYNAKIAEANATLGVKAADLVAKQKVVDTAKTDKFIDDASHSNKFVDNKPDLAADAASRSFARENLSTFKDSAGNSMSTADLTDTQRKNLLGEFEAAQELNANSNAADDTQWIGASGHSNKMLQLGEQTGKNADGSIARNENTMRRSTWRDIGEGGVGFSPLWDGAWGADDRVIQTSDGLRRVTQLVGDGPRAADRARRFADIAKKSKGMR